MRLITQIFIITCVFLPILAHSDMVGTSSSVQPERSYIQGVTSMLPPFQHGPTPGMKLACKGADIGFCAECGKNDDVLVSSKKFEFLRKHMHKCVEQVCGEPKAQFCGVGGFAPRNVADSQSVSRHATGDGMDIGTLKCANGKTIKFDLTSHGGSLQKAVQAKEVKSKESSKTCNHAQPSAEYLDFAKCWNDVVAAHPCPGNSGGAITAPNGVPDYGHHHSANCAHVDHMHISFCAERGAPKQAAQ